ncbi:MAG: hypothetical protein NVS3B3_01880 [Aquirhabdus sp.]
MMDTIARALVSASQVDGELKDEIAGFPADFIIQMIVLPNGSRFNLRVLANKTLIRLDNFQGKPDLSIKFKHLSHAFLVFSFQESTSRAFANDRMIADGEVSYAIRLVRCLNKLEALILPKPIAKLAVKQYPSNLTLGEKATKAAQIYADVVTSYADLIPKAAHLINNHLNTTRLNKTGTGANK